MRFIGLILSLGAITWVLYQASGGGEAETIIPEGHQQALDKAKGVEQTLMDATQKKMQALEENQP
jgi:preprotein translocase subunit SecG